MSRIPPCNFVFFHSVFGRVKLRIAGTKYLIESYLFLTTLFFTHFLFQLSNLSLDSSHFPLILITSLFLDSFFTVTFSFLVQSHLCPSAPASSPPCQPSLYPPWIPPTASNVSCSEQPQAIQSVHNILNAATSPFSASKPRFDIPAWLPYLSANEGSNF